MQEILGTKIMVYTHPDYRERWHQLQLALWHHELAESSFNHELSTSGYNF
ncbi:hypothetical protein [Mucilaginibacter corticis]|nr:hypothetical protein [Mucilaginibacter corticis]